jgi:hypothetical protein
MRAAVFLVVLAIHVALFFVFAVFRNLTPRSSAQPPSTVVFFVPPTAHSTPGQVAVPHPNTPGTAAVRPRPVPQQPAAVPDSPLLPAPEPDSNAITEPTVPDWRQELQVAANNQLESAERKRQQPSPLSPHDFSRVMPGSTDSPRQDPIWNYAATHRVEELPFGGLVININDRCAMILAPLPFGGCRIGKIPARGNLFDHMKDTPEPHP